jgi:heme-binding NEAT domain protein
MKAFRLELTEEEAIQLNTLAIEHGNKFKPFAEYLLRLQLGTAPPPTVSPMVIPVKASPKKEEPQAATPTKEQPKTATPKQEIQPRKKPTTGKPTTGGSTKSFSMINPLYPRMTSDGKTYRVYSEGSDLPEDFNSFYSEQQAIAEHG